MTDFSGLLQTLSSAGVEFILVGGAAATAHGAARLTWTSLTPPCPTSALRR
jgi:hypothetical protein